VFYSEWYMAVASTWITENMHISYLQSKKMTNGCGWVTTRFHRAHSFLSFTVYIQYSSLLFWYYLFSIQILIRISFHLFNQYFYLFI